MKVRYWPLAEQIGTEIDASFTSAFDWEAEQSNLRRASLLSTLCRSWCATVLNGSN
jgi:hypothetical protein